MRPPGLGTKGADSQEIPDIKLPLLFEHIELPTKLLDYFLRSNTSNINQVKKFCLVQEQNYKLALPELTKRQV